MARNDFNGDGRSDILWLLNDDQAVSNWLATADGGFANNDSKAYNDLNAWDKFTFIASGDYNGDGRSDILWLVDNSDYMVGLTGPAGSLDPFSSNNPFITVQTSGWSIAGSGDFNGDGIDDLLWRNADGRLSDWLGTASGNFVINDAKAMRSVATDWKVEGIGDFNGDGRDDILWGNRTSGKVSNWLANADGSFVVNDENALHGRDPGAILGIGDFNRDGRDDLLLQLFGNELYTEITEPEGTFYPEWDLGFLARTPAGWGIAAIGDYNGDRAADILWRSSTGALSNWLSQDDGYHFAINDANAFRQVSPAWQVADWQIHAW